MPRWNNTRWIVALFAIVVLDVPVLLAIASIAHVKLLTSFGYVVILNNTCVLIWYRRSPFWSRNALRAVLLVTLGGGIVLAGTWILDERYETIAAASLFLVVLIARHIGRRLLLKKLRAENEKEKLL